MVGIGSVTVGGVGVGGVSVGVEGASGGVAGAGSLTEAVPSNTIQYVRPLSLLRNSTCYSDST